MFALRLFGAPLLSGPEGPLAGRAAQRHPLALLAFLARDPSETASREKLLALLWPESDTESARRLLNVAVHALRKALGETAIQSVGSSLRLDHALVKSDVRAFADALAAGDPARAVEAYGGPFLDGFFLDAEGFDRWAEEERARLADRFAEELERLAGAEEAAGDPVRAAAWWKRRAALDACDSRVALRLMEAMAAAGDRAGAVRHAAVHAALLRDELGAEPDRRIGEAAARLRISPAGLGIAPPAPPTVADEAPVATAFEAPPLALSIAPPPDPARPAPKLRVAVPIASGRRRARTRGRRAGTVFLLSGTLAMAAAAGAASRLARPPAAAAETPTVAVFPFQPLRAGGDGGEGERADDELRVGLADEIIHDLSRTAGVRVVSRSFGFVYDGRRLDVRDVGTELGVTHVVEGNIRREDGRVRVSVYLVAVADGGVRWSGQYDRPAADPFRVQSEIAAEVAAALRAELGGEAGAAPAPEPAAYAAYLEARRAARMRTPDGVRRAVAKLRESIARDSSFALAHAGLADAFVAAVEHGLVAPGDGYREAEAAARRALELAPTSGEAHAALASVLVARGGRWLAGKCCDGAEYHFRRAVELDPAGTYHGYSLGLLSAGYAGEARDAIRMAQLLDPRSAPASAELGRQLYYAGELREAAAELRRAALLDPALPDPHVWLGLVHLQADSLPAALREFGRADLLLGGDHPLATALLAHAHARMGRRREAEALLVRMEEAARHGRYVSPWHAAMAEIGLGRHDDAVEHLGRALAEQPGLAPMLRLDPLLDPLRRTPRFQRLLNASAP